MTQLNGLKYLKIRDLLVEQFRKQGYQQGTKLPGELALTKELGVSRTTIRQALSMLEEDGIIEKRHGSGTFFIGYTSRYPKTESKKGTIGLVNFYCMDYIYPEIVRGIEDTLFEKGYYLIPTNCYLDHEKEIDAVLRLIDQGVQGLILEPSRNVQIDENHPMMKLIETRGIPTVSTHWGVSNTNISTVTIDDVHAGYRATRHLIELGHRRIAMVYKEDVQAGNDRFTGFKKAMHEASIHIEKNLVANYCSEDELSNFEQGYLLTRTLLQDQPTAIFYFNDRTAQQGYGAIREAGLSIPKDISVVGFDNYHTSSILRPPLTTFEHPKYNLGKWAAQLLLDEIEHGKNSIPVNMIFQPRLLVRSSTAIAKLS